jgi:DNA-binding PucR family transcriptional regulator
VSHHNLSAQALCIRANAIVTGGHVVVTWGMTPVATRTARSERDRILTGLHADLEELAERALARMPEEIPAYASRDAAFFADVRDQLCRHYRTKLAALEHRPLSRQDLAFARPCALRRARAGIALDDFLHAFRIGRQVFWEAVLDRAGEFPAGHEAALELATEVMRYSDIACTHASRAYVEYQQHLVADADRERRDLLEHLLAGELPTHRPLLAAAQAYGLAERIPALVATAMPVTADADASHVAAEALARSGVPARRALVVRRRGELVVVAALRPADPAADAADVCDRLQETQRRLRIGGVPLAVGVGTVASGIAELPRAYQEASAALADVGVDGGVVALPRLSPFDYLALHADDTARRLVDPRLRTFLEEDRQRGGGLIETARVFAAADLNLRVAAERLQVHPNTAQYRLRRIEERTGRNPRRIADLVDLLSAIALLDRARTR